MSFALWDIGFAQSLGQIVSVPSKNTKQYKASLPVETRRLKMPVLKFSNTTTSTIACGHVSAVLRQRVSNPRGEWEIDLQEQRG